MTAVIREDVWTCPGTDQADLRSESWYFESSDGGPDSMATLKTFIPCTATWSLSLAKCARKLISESQRSNEMPTNLGQELNYEAGWRSVKQVMPCCMLASGWRFAIVSLLWRRDIVVGAENPRTGKTVAEKAGVTRGDERFESKSSLISTRFSSTWRISWRRRTSVLSFSSKFQKSEMDRNGIFWGHANQ